MTTDANKLPDSFVEEGLRLARGAMLFGVPMEELSPVELLAACAQGWKSSQEAQKALNESLMRALG